MKDDRYKMNWRIYLLGIITVVEKEFTHVGANCSEI